MKTAWYKEPWAWLVFFLPFSAVVAGITTVIIANTKPDTLVAGDYYKKGKAINQELSKIKQAQKLGMAFNFSYIDNEIIVEPIGIEKQFPLLTVALFHPTLQQHDKTFKLTADANGLYRTFVETPLSGKWRLTIADLSGAWKLEQMISLPQSQALVIKPELTQ